MTYIGNEEILKNHKIAFFCSQRCPAEVILKSFDWAIEQRNKGNCIITCAHSPVEKDVFHFLLKGEQPLILVTGGVSYSRLDKAIRKAVEERRLLIINPCNDNRRLSKDSALRRNIFVSGIADEITVSFASPLGSISRLLDKLDPTKKITFFK